MSDSAIPVKSKFIPQVPELTYLVQLVPREASRGFPRSSVGTVNLVIRLPGNLCAILCLLSFDRMPVPESSVLPLNKAILRLSVCGQICCNAGPGHCFTSRGSFDAVMVLLDMMLAARWRARRLLDRRSQHARVCGRLQCGCMAAVLRRRERARNALGLLLLNAPPRFLRRCGRVATRMVIRRSLVLAHASNVRSQGLGAATPARRAQQTFFHVALSARPCVPGVRAVTAGQLGGLAVTAGPPRVPGLYLGLEAGVGLVAACVHARTRGRHAKKPQTSKGTHGSQSGGIGSALQTLCVGASRRGK